MIVAIEGPSAVGKTTWCRTQAPSFVKEAPPGLDAPDLFADPLEVANFWVGFNSGLWQSALQVEKQGGIAVCDSDPFHLYFSFSLWKSGVMDRRLFDAEVRLYRRAIVKHQVGLVDFVMWQEAPLEELRRRARGDKTQRRRRHELYLTLIPWMKLWFEAREQAIPGSVGNWSEVQALNLDDLKHPRTESHRYGVATFDRMVRDLTSC